MNTVLQTENPRVVSEAEWTAARLALLAREKELTRLRDDVSRERQALPWVGVEKDYVFEGPDGRETLADLFGGRSQLVIYHFMFGPGWEEGCDGCSFLADHIDGAEQHLRHHDVSLVVVSRAPFTEFQAFKARMGWRFKWVSSFGSDFNYDYHVSFREGEESTYNYEVRESGEEGEGPGISVFAKNEAGEVFHTYSSYARGGDLLIGTYNWLDLTPKGRNEREIMDWVRLHDEYEPVEKPERACAELDSPRIVEHEPLTVAGLEEVYTFGNMGGILAQWGRFVPSLGQIPGQVDGATYGVCWMIEGGVRYLAGVGVDALAGLPQDFSAVRLPAQRYAVFPHHGDISTLCQTIEAIWSDGLSALGREALPMFLERYGPGFDPETGSGDIEIWVPLRA